MACDFGQLGLSRRVFDLAWDSVPFLNMGVPEIKGPMLACFCNLAFGSILSLFFLKPAEKDKADRSLLLRDTWRLTGLGIYFE